MAPDEQIITQHKAGATGTSSRALGVLAAVSAGGLMALRMKHAPLFFLAGAAAAALLSRKRVIPPARPMELMPRREPGPMPQKLVGAPPDVETWLARQMEREQLAPVITLEVVEPPSAPDVVPVPEPQVTALDSLKLEASDRGDSPQRASIPEVPKELYEVPGSHESGAVMSWGSFLAEVPSEPSAGGFLAAQGFSDHQNAPEPLIVEAAGHASVRADASSNASWLLDIEPLPSLDELSADLTAHTNASTPEQAAFMSSAPGFTPVFESPYLPAMPAAEMPSLQPAFVPALFQGAELPDEIMVAEVSAPFMEQVKETETERVDAPLVTEAPASTAESAMAGLFIPSAAFLEPPILSVEALEVPVSLAEPGEASFDDPLAILEENPSSVPGGMAPLPPLRPLAPVVEAEIVVRPRGLAATKVQAKPVPDAPVEFGVVPTIEREGEPMVKLEDPFEPKAPPVSDHPAADKAVFPQPELPPAPVVLPREQKARKTWRSWWRGD